MEVEMILLNLTKEILENAKKEGREVVEVEMTLVMAMEEVAEEATLIQQAAEMQPTRKHYRTRWSERSQKFYWRMRQGGGVYDQLERLSGNQQTNLGDE